VLSLKTESAWNGVCPTTCETEPSIHGRATHFSSSRPPQRGAAQVCCRPRTLPKTLKTRFCCGPDQKLTWFLKGRRYQRLLLTFGLGVLAALYVLFHRWANPGTSSDLMQVWIAARAWLHGDNPYTAVRAWQQWPYPLLYPFPAVLILTPLTVLPAAVADSMFIGASTSLLAWAITREQVLSPNLVVFVSAPFLYAIALVQWSPLLTGAALTPLLGFLLVCKPTIGLALFCAFPRWKTGIGSGLLLALSVSVWPHWINEWRSAIAEAPNAIAPVTLWGGPLMLLVLIRWRRPESRLLAALACIPHTTLAYEAVPLFLVPRTWAETWIVWGGTYESQLAWVRASGYWLMLCAYLPCVALVLRRPNVAPDAENVRVTPA
jgi:hypothetical protein